MLLTCASVNRIPTEPLTACSGVVVDSFATVAIPLRARSSMAEPVDIEVAVSLLPVAAVAIAGEAPGKTTNPVTRAAPTRMATLRRARPASQRLINPAIVFLAALIGAKTWRI
jgi:hypothetical protein